MRRNEPPCEAARCRWQWLAFQGVMDVPCKGAKDVALNVSACLSSEFAWTMMVGVHPTWLPAIGRWPLDPGQ